MIEHIRINDVAPCVAYRANGAQAAFIFPFAVFKAADLEVWLDQTLADAGYSVSGAGVSSGGSVVFAVPPAAGVRVTLRRRIALARTTDFQTDGIIRAKTLNDELDYQVAAVQQVAEDVSRCVRRPFTSASTADLSLPDPVPDRGLKWNADGSGLVNTDLDFDTIGAAAAQVALDRVAVAEDRTAVEVTAAEARQAADLAAAMASSVSFPLDRRRNLADVESVAAAQANLGIAELERSLRKAEDNLFLTTLRMIANAGSTYLKMVDGFSDEFEDVTGVAVNVAVGGRAFANSQYLTYGPANAFDGSATTYWASDELLNASSGVSSVGYELPTPMVVRRVRVTFAHTPTAWHLQYYNGAAWVTVTTIAVTASVMDVDVPAVSTPSAYWRLLSASNAAFTGSVATYGISVREIEFFAEDKSATPSSGVTYDATGNFFTNSLSGTSVNDMVLRSRIYAAAAQPVRGRVVGVVERVEPLAHGLDNALRLSRDGGATFAEGAVLVEAVGLTFDGHVCDIISASFDLNEQPAGSAVRAEFRTKNGKKQRIHGWYVDLAR